MLTRFCVAVNLYCGAMRTEAFQRFRATQTNNESWPFVSATMALAFSVKDTSMPAKPLIRSTIATLSCRGRRLPGRDLRKSAHDRTHGRVPQDVINTRLKAGVH